MVVPIRLEATTVDSFVRPRAARATPVVGSTMFWLIVSPVRASCRCGVPIIVFVISWGMKPRQPTQVNG